MAKTAKMYYNVGTRIQIATQNKVSLVKSTYEPTEVELIPVPVA